MKLLIDGDLFCKACSTNKPKVEFHKDSSGKRGFAFYCKVCANEKSKQWQLKNKNDPKHRRIQANSFFKRNYGISIEEREAMLKEQNNNCGVCKINLTGIRIHTDHCHITGKIRKLLCSKCNHGLGFFNDSIPTLKLAIEYLESYS